MAGKMIVSSYRAAGEYFIRLALEEEPVPATTDEAKAKLLENGVDVRSYSKVVIHVDDDDTLNLVVRQKSLIEPIRKALEEDRGVYAFPFDLEAIYGRYFADKASFKGADAVDDRVKLYESRLGDYTFSHCA